MERLAEHFRWDSNWLDGIWTNRWYFARGTPFNMRRSGIPDGRDQDICHLTAACAPEADVRPRQLIGVLRQAQLDDIPGMHRVRLAVRENRLTSSAIREEHYAPEITITGRGWVVTEAEVVVAFAVGNREDKNIWALFVDPEHERKGYGRQLHEAMVEWLFAQDVQCIWLSTDPGTRAQRFYEAAGWCFRRILPDGEHYYELHRNAI